MSLKEQKLEALRHAARWLQEQSVMWGRASDELRESDMKTPLRLKSAGYRLASLEVLISIEDATAPSPHHERQLKSLDGNLSSGD